jgi:hypothetical protein
VEDASQAQSRLIKASQAMKKIKITKTCQKSSFQTLARPPQMRLIF